MQLHSDGVEPTTASAVAATPLNTYIQYNEKANYV